MPACEVLWVWWWYVVTHTECLTLSYDMCKEVWKRTAWRGVIVARQVMIDFMTIFDDCGDVRWQRDIKRWFYNSERRTCLHNCGWWLNVDEVCNEECWDKKTKVVGEQHDEWSMRDCEWWSEVPNIMISGDDCVTGSDEVGRGAWEVHGGELTTASGDCVMGGEVETERGAWTVNSRLTSRGRVDDGLWLRK